MTVVDQLRTVREVAMSEDERLRREGARLVECQLTIPLADLDRIILEIEERDRLVTRYRQLYEAAHRRVVVVLILAGLLIAMDVVTWLLELMQ